MKKIVFITHKDARYGFSICGAAQYAIAPGDTEPTLKMVMADPENGVAVIDERLMEGISEERFREMERRWRGVIVLLPAPEGGAGEEDYAMRLIRRAIGYHVRLNP